MLSLPGEVNLLARLQAAPTICAERLRKMMDSTDTDPLLARTVRDWVACALVCILALLSAARVRSDPAAASLSVDIARRAYYRGEDVVVAVECRNTSAAPIRDAILAASISGWEKASARLRSVAVGETIRTTIRVPTTRIRSGEYRLKVVLTDGNGKVAEATERVAIAGRPNPERLMVWLWGGGGDLDWYPRHGFTSCGGPTWRSLVGGQLPESMRRYLDGALVRGLDANIGLNGGIRDSDVDPGKINDPDATYMGGDRRVKFANPYHPAVVEQRDEANRRLMQAVRDYPQIRTSFFNTEVVDDMSDIENQAALRLMKQRLGFTKAETGPPKYGAPGVIADDDRGYLFRKFIYQRGNGLVMANRQVAAMVKRYRPDILTITDPYRQVPLYGLFDGVDCVETWTYTNPDPKLMLYVETLRTACKPGKQIPISTVTMLNYPGQLAPTDEWMLMDAGRIKVTTWINLSRAPSIVGYYYSSECNPVGTDTFKTPYSTSAAIKELAEKVFRPYGPMIRNLRICPRRIAVLSSAASRRYGKSPTLMGHYYNIQIYHFCSVMAMAHLQADVLFDETIERYGLDGYDVLVLPKCDVLPKSVYEKILDFRKRGGTVIADQYLGPQIPGVIQFDFDFTYRDKVNANAIAKNTTYAQWDDHLEPGSAELHTVEGVTALDDQKIMESYAAALKQRLAGKVAWEVDCDQPTVLFNMLERGRAKYLFVINDKRTYDERLGKYKAVLGKVVPQTVTVSLKRRAYPRLYAYDMLARKQLEVGVAGGAHQFTVDLSDLGGTIVALYPEPLAAVVVSAPAKMKAGAPSAIEVAFHGQSGALLPGLQPVQVSIADPRGDLNEFSGYYCAKDGSLRIGFFPAVNDRLGQWKVTAIDLTSGMTAERGFELER